MHDRHPFVRPVARLAAAVLALLTPACSARGQNLYTDPNAATQAPTPASPAALAPGAATPLPSTTREGPSARPAGETTGGGAPGNVGAQPQPGAPPGGGGPPLALQSVSLFAVSAPPPRAYAKHDQIQVIINESSIQQFNQTLDTKKDFDMSAELSRFPSFKALFEDLALREGITGTHPGLGVKSNDKFKGEGKFNRNDKVQAKITATVVDVKPNGNLVLEARQSIQSDKEVSTMVLAGTCRVEDVTKNNTVQSNQLAGLTIRIEHEGEVKDTGSKGLIPRVLEAVFNF